MLPHQTAACVAMPGVRVLPTAPYSSFPDCMHPQDAFPRYFSRDVAAEQVVKLGDTYLQSMHIWYIWDRAADKVLEKHKELVAGGWPSNTTVVLDLPCPFLAIMTLTCMEAAQEAATALKFNRTLVTMARTIINGMKQAGVTRYNGAHLRCALNGWALGCSGQKTDEGGQYWATCLYGVNTLGDEEAWFHAFLAHQALLVSREWPPCVACLSS